MESSDTNKSDHCPRPTHTPYDGTAGPFAIGLKPLPIDDWIEVDDDLETYLGEKDILFALHRPIVLRDSPESRDAQQELLDLLCDHLPKRFPESYRRHGAMMEVGRAGRSIDTVDPALPPIERAARLVQEDLVVMMRGENGWCLAAAALAFPSSWSLAEKAGRPMAEIHRTVPGFGPGTRNALLIERIFDSLKPAQPVWRLNWSIYPDDALHHPKGKADSAYADFAPAFGLHDTFLRVERQTLRKLPLSDAIAFTIRIHVDPLATIAAHPDAPGLAGGLHDQLAALDADQIAYKGLGETRQRLLDELAALKGSAAT